MSAEYESYLLEHINAVKNAARWMVDNLAVIDEMPAAEVDDFLLNVDAHDESKYEVVEYGPYDAYFYGTPNDDAFNVAWLHHIHHNPHHWQHWLLVNDDGEVGSYAKAIALEMPKVHALEMIADWWSFSWRSGNLAEMFDWYASHRNCIILHENTRRYVEGVMDEIRDALGIEVPL